MDKVERIIQLLEQGDHETAMKEYKKVLKNGTAEEKYDLAEEFFQYGFLKEAKALIEDLLKGFPEEGELLVLLADILIEAGNEEEALLVLERISQNDPSYPQALLLMADLYQLQGLYEVSERKLLNAKEILPGEVIIDFALGELFKEQGEVAKAIKAYKKVLMEQNEVAGVDVNQRIADILSLSGAFEDALPYYEKALEDKLEINTLFGFAFTALQAGYYRIAIEKFIELKELDPEYHSLYLHLAKAYESEEELEKSLDAIKDGIKQDEFSKELYFYGGKILLKLGREEEAENLLRESIALDPGYTEAILTLNKLFLHEERYEDVLDLIKETEVEEAEEPQMLWDAAVAYHKIEEFSHALNKYESAYTFLKNNETFLQDYGYFLLEEGKNIKAAEIFKQLLKIDPTNGEYLEILGRLTEM